MPSAWDKREQLCVQETQNNYTSLIHTRLVYPE